MQEYVPTTLSKQGKHEISIYKPGTINPNILGSGIKMIMQAFPKLPAGWYSVLKEMLKDEEFNDERFSDSIKSLIKNCPYPEPAIANIIGYDKTIKVFLWNELLEKTKEDSPQTRAEYLNNFIAIDFYGEQRFARKEDVERYNLKKWRYNKDKAKNGL